MNKREWIILGCALLIIIIILVVRTNIFEKPSCTFGFDYSEIKMIRFIDQNNNDISSRFEIFQFEDTIFIRNKINQKVVSLNVSSLNQKDNNVSIEYFDEDKTNNWYSSNWTKEVTK